MPVEVCCNSAIVLAERDGHFGLRQSLIGVFLKAVSLTFKSVSPEHGLTEDGKTVAPIFEAFASCPSFVITVVTQRFAHERSQFPRY